MKKLIAFLTLFLMIPVALLAQVTTSALSGSVKDEEGRGLAGATIQAVHMPSNTRYSTMSQANGSFNITNMRTGGPYTITVSFVNFQTQTFDESYLTLGEGLNLNVNLKNTTTNLEQVVVTSTSGRSIINSNRTGATTNIGSREIQRMPTITRSLNDLTALTPQSNGSSIGGGNYRQNQITVDGSDFNNSFGIGTNLPAGGSPISLDALDEISVSLTPFDVRQSGFIGSAINAVTRSGTNKFQGSAYYYWRSEQEQGDKVGKTTVNRTPFDFKMYGARLGGPIIKDKLFFFLSYETENQPKLVQTRLASSAANPYTGTGNVARPSADSMKYISDYLSSKYGYATGPYDNYNTDIQRTKILGRIDWNINSNHRFNIRYNQVEGGEPNPPSTSRSPLSSFAGSAGRTSINALWFQNSNYWQGANFYSFAGELNSTFGNRIGNTLRGTYTYQNDSRESDSQIFPFVDILSNGTPYTSFGYEPFTFGNLRKVKMYSFVDNLTYSVKNHLLTLGLQADFSQTINGFQRFATSYYTFNSWSDFANGKNPSDFAFTYSLSPNFEQAFPSFKFAQYSAYLQDDIKVTDRLKVMAGLRFDLPTYPDVAEIKTHPLVQQLTFAEGQKINTGLLPKKSVLFSPRLGFNYDVLGDRSLQVRGGAGIFTGKVPFVWIVSQSGDAGLLQVTQTFSGANVPGPFNPDPKAYLPSTVPAAGTVIPSTISALSPDFKFPQSFKASLAFDKRLGKSWFLTMEGILNKDIRTTVFENPNLKEPAPLNVAGYPDNRMFYGATNTTKYINPLTSAGQVSPTGTSSFNTIVMSNGSKGYYFAFTTKAEKQFSKGLAATLSYTYSLAQNLFDGNGDQPLSAWQGTANVNGSNFPVLGSAGFVVPHRVMGFVSYRKEYLKFLGTTLSLSYDGSSQGKFSYTYTSDFNRDGTNFDLIYIPKDPSEITFVTKTIGSGATAKSFSPKEQSDAFFNYIEQDPYLRKHKGEYAQRNAANMPWRHQVNVKVLQDVFKNIGKSRNTIQFSLDIFNLLNLIDPYSGNYKFVTASSILEPTNTSSLTPGGTTKPTFRLATVGSGLPTESFSTVQTVSSTYYMQFGVRYIFN